LIVSQVSRLTREDKRHLGQPTERDHIEQAGQAEARGLLGQLAHAP